MPYANKVTIQKTCFQGSRRARGSFVAEVPLAIWMILVCLLFPLLILATITIRTTFFNLAAKEAAHAAAKAKIYKEGSAPVGTSAQEIAKDKVAQVAGRITGLTVDSVTTFIVITKISSQEITRQQEPLSAAPEVDENIYQIEVQANGKVDPLLKLNSAIFGNVKGLTAPIPLTAVGREIFEEPQGLFEAPSN